MINTIISDQELFSKQISSCYDECRHKYQNGQSSRRFRARQADWNRILTRKRKKKYSLNRFTLQTNRKRIVWVNSPNTQTLIVPFTTVFYRLTRRGGIDLTIPRYTLLSVGNGFRTKLIHILRSDYLCAHCTDDTSRSHSQPQRPKMPFAVWYVRENNGGLARNRTSSASVARATFKDVKSQIANTPWRLH